MYRLEDVEESWRQFYEHNIKPFDVVEPENVWIAKLIFLAGVSAGFQMQTVRSGEATAVFLSNFGKITEQTREHGSKLINVMCDSCGALLSKTKDEAYECSECGHKFTSTEQKGH